VFYLFYVIFKGSLYFTFRNWKHSGSSGKNALDFLFCLHYLTFFCKKKSGHVIETENAVADDKG
jgi:hypothetical protein